MSKTSIHSACKDGMIDVVHMLIESGQNINEENRQRQTPLDIACKSDNIDLVTYLLGKGANKVKLEKVTTNPEIIEAVMQRLYGDMNDNTALQLSILNKLFIIAEIMIVQGNTEYINHTNSQGLTALDILLQVWSEDDGFISDKKFFYLYDLLETKGAVTNNVDIDPSNLELIEANRVSLQNPMLSANINQFIKDMQPLIQGINKRIESLHLRIEMGYYRLLKGNKTILGTVPAHPYVVVLCLYDNSKECVSSILLEFVEHDSPNGYSIDISSKTKETERNKSYNTLLRAVTILMMCYETRSEDSLPIHFISSMATNPITSYVLLHKLNGVCIQNDFSPEKGLSKNEFISYCQDFIKEKHHMYIENRKEEKSCSDAKSVLEDFISRRVSSRSGGMTRNKRQRHRRKRTCREYL
jgi:hypothetical protein